jgi:hypothetical protein
MMFGGGDLAFVAMAINPIGGLTIAIPYAVFELKYAPWLALGVGLPLAYTQVIVVDLSFGVLYAWPWWRRWIERRQSPRIRKIVDSRGGFWVTTIFSPFVGPWLVMALMRCAGIPHRRVALPLFLGIAWTACLVTIACVWLPRVVGR